MMRRAHRMDKRYRSIPDARWAELRQLLPPERPKPIAVTLSAAKVHDKWMRAPTLDAVPPAVRRLAGASVPLLSRQGLRV
jgi:hypothetical protein